MRRLRPELAVLVALLASFLTIPLRLPHVAAAIVWAALTAVHVARRRRIYAALLRSGRRRRVVATTALIGCAAVVTVSGFVQWAGVAAAIPWHAGSSTLLIALAAAHAVRRLWRVRTRRRVSRSWAHKRGAGAYRPDGCGVTPRAGTVTRCHGIVQGDASYSVGGSCLIWRAPLSLGSLLGDILAGQLASPVFLYH